MSEPLLILEGRRAASWLAAAGHLVGLASPASYAQADPGDEIFKVNNHICLVRGRKITENTEENWQKMTPDGLLLHRLSKTQAQQLGRFFATSVDG
ncbi:hypothetical protein [Sneathiella sp.]|uniref:hypothetical protein n=1 Tax=Sneathiella sp. TaxID=1964365 RepID=UPI002FE0D44E